MMHDQDQIDLESPGSKLSRRAVVAGTGMLAAAATVVGCGSYGEQGGDASAPGYPPGQGRPTAAPAAPSGAALTSTSDIPVGGGQIFTDEKVVVTQAEPGTFAAFSAVCTHQGCVVNKVEGGTIDCPCHGSKFAIADGAVVSGPAKRPLDSREVVVEGNQIRLA